MQTLSIAISPCPNDTFIFENIATQKIGIPNINFEFHYLDIAELNTTATEAKYDIVKISCVHLQHVDENYALLKSGGAMGFGVGPIIVTKKNNLANLDETASIAIPGKTTTANFLLNYCYPQITASQKNEYVFHEIENAVLQGEVDFGVLIHEGRFTYQEKGLALVKDLGKLWEEKEHLPIPLGCIVAKKGLGEIMHQQIENLITNSISNYNEDGSVIISDYIRQYAHEMEESVIRQHINLYVNDYSKQMGTVATRLKDIFKLHTLRS